MKHDVEHSIEHSIELAQQLETLLLDEARALGARDTDALHQVSTRKQQLATTLEAETQRQRQWVIEAGLTFTSEGVHDFLSRFENASELEGRWSLLHETVRRCESMNCQNADLIQRQRRRIDQSLRLLRGDDGVSTTYDPSGKTASAMRSRTLSRA